MTKIEASDYIEFLGGLARWIVVFAVAITAAFLYGWLLYSIATHGVDQRIKEDRHNVPENIGG